MSQNHIITGCLTERHPHNVVLRSLLQRTADTPNAHNVVLRSLAVPLEEAAPAGIATVAIPASVAVHPSADPTPRVRDLDGSPRHGPTPHPEGTLRGYVRGFAVYCDR